MSAEALLALGYAAFLLAAAIGLDLLARHSHTRSTRYRTAGFSYQPDSDLGREITQSLDPWPHSEAGRFHRGVCVVLVFLAALISAIALVRSDGLAELLALTAMLGVSVAATGRLLGAFRRTPTGFPVTPPAS